MWLVTIMYLCFSSAYMYSEGKPPELYMTANSAVLTLEGPRDYYFHDGEQTQFTCHGNDNVYILYTWKDGSEELICHTSDAAEGRVYMKLGARDNNTSLRCCLGHPDYYDTNTVKIEVRLIVKPQKNRTDIIGFTVNGLITSGVSSARGLQHQYSYFSGEQLVVEVTGGAGAGVSCRFEGTNVPNDLTAEKIEKYLMKLKYVLKIILDQNQTNLRLSCSAPAGAGALLQSSIKFTLYNDSDYVPYVTGLSFGRIMMQYNIYGTNTVLYEYRPADRLTLTCVSQSDNPYSQWEYNPREVFTKYKHRGQTLKFELYPHANSTTITYTVYHPWFKITLIRTEEKRPLAAVIDVARVVSADKRKLRFAAGAAVAGGALLAAAAVKFLCKRKATQEASVDTAVGEIELKEHEEGPTLHQEERGRGQ